MEESVSVILSGYRRPHALKEQFDAVKNQTVEVAEILYWQNKFRDGIQFDQHIVNFCTSFVGNANLGVWARFAFALNCKSKYICILDDDTIPGPMWLENCINSNREKRGLYGTIGLIYKGPDTYYGAQRVGWDGINNTETMKVDIVGHAWFFERELLTTFWRELPEPGLLFVGEDMHFSHMIQKYTDMATYVPPHPDYNKKLWGSTKGMELGGDVNATGNFAVPMMDEFYKKCIAKGFKIINSNG